MPGSLSGHGPDAWVLHLPQVTLGAQASVLPKCGSSSSSSSSQLCLAPGARLRSLRWYRGAAFDRRLGDFAGPIVAALGDGAVGGRDDVAARAEFWGDPDGNCSLLLRDLRAADAGLYGLRLVANGSRGASSLRWMHNLSLIVTETPPAPHLQPPPDPLLEGHPAQVGCWLPPACPAARPPRLAWDGPAAHLAQALGDRARPWGPPPAPDQPPDAPPALGTLLPLTAPTWRLDGARLDCLHLDPHGRTLANASLLLRVRYAPRDPRVEVSPPTPVLEGQEVTLSCRLTANPPPYTHLWTRDGQPLPQSGAQLRLTPARPEDRGTYRCQASNTLGTAASSDLFLDVYYAPRDPRVVVSPPAPALKGQEVTLSCRVMANPLPYTHLWTRDGQPLPQSGAQLRLTPARPEDRGTYRCQASNTLGTAASSDLFLDVYYPPHGATLEALTPLPALSGTRVTLRCTLGPARPDPSPTVHWLRDGRLDTDTASPTLSFEAAPARAGSYSCEGRNVAGAARSLPLAVEIWFPPQAVQVEQWPGGAVAAGRPVRLRCVWAGARPPVAAVAWFKEGRPLAPAGPELPLAPVSPPDAGAYACEAQNAAGRARSPPTHLQVLYGPQEVELVPEPGPTVMEAADVVLRCRAAAWPPPAAFEWFRDGRRLGWAPQDLWVLQAVGTQASGRYRCRANNTLASADSPEVTITVYYSTATILWKTFLGLGVGLGSLLLLGTLGCCLHRRWRRVAADEEPVVEPSGTFFLRNKKPGHLGPPRQPRTAGSPEGPTDATLSYSSLLFPSGCSSGTGTRLRGDTVVYSVLKRSQGGAKATEGPDYENVHPGQSDGDGNREGTLLYAALALSSPGTPQGRCVDTREAEDTVEYAALRH
ncbi:B-cell receptor CD22 isoform X2 [Struthio camelus]|uniref:B-cell receptor CD22 isoform X2 n=1 Tax=Struthio camelus TaxID=8801 RepID=UPI003603F048